MSLNFEFVGLTPAHGREYVKGNIRIVIYHNGAKKYWPNLNNHKIYERNETGLTTITDITKGVVIYVQYENHKY